MKEWKLFKLANIKDQEDTDETGAFHARVS
jgi:hypothetical protein